MTCGVYLITHVPTGKRYVGSSTKMEYRWEQHQKAPTKSYHDNPRIQALADEYGVESFTFEVLETMENERPTPYNHERWWIRELQPELNLSDTLEATAKRKAQWTLEKKRQHGQMLKEVSAKKKAEKKARQAEKGS